MKTLSAVVALLLATLALAAPRPERSLSKVVLEDKIRGGWAGQMIGVSYGAPTEFRSNGKIIEGNLNNYLDWSPERLKNAIDQDDLYVEMTFAEVMDRRGLEATTEEYGEMFKDSQYELWHANAGARRLLNHGSLLDHGRGWRCGTHALLGRCRHCQYQHRQRRDSRKCRARK